MFISKPTFVNSECKYSNISPFLRTFADDFNKICEMEETFNPIAHEKQFLGELKDIRKIADSFDVVMFPIDGRVGNGK